MELTAAMNAFHCLTRQVEPHMTAAAVGSGGLEVLSTPWMIALMESASRDAVQGFLPAGYTTVGTRVDIRHTAPLFLGAQVTVESRLVEIKDRLLMFEVRAFGENGEIGSGNHERAVVNMDRFLSNMKKGT